MNNDEAVDNVHKKIEREKALITAANTMIRSTNNQQVLSRLETQIRDGRRNIEYLEGRLRELEMRRMGNNMESMNLNSGSNRDTSPPPHGGAMGHQGYGQGYPQPGEYDSPGPGQQYSQLSGGSIPMPPNPPFARPGPGGSGMPKGRPNYSRLDLIKYDTPHLGPRIQLMLSQLEFKLSVEKQYKDGIEKMVRLYQLEGDRKSKSDAEARRIESNQKIQLLKSALKRYEDLHVDIEGSDERDDDSVSMPNVRKPLSGRLSIRIQAVHDVDHATTSRFSRGPETFVIIKVEDVFKGRTRAAKGDRWTDELHEFDIDKANEIELTVYDRAGDHPVPIGMIWLRISDIVEELRRKRIETEFNQAGWVSADKMGDGQAGMQFKPPPTAGGFTAGGSMAVGLGAPSPGMGPGAPVPQTGPLFVDSWFSLEPAGRIHLTIGFVKQTRDRKPIDVGLIRQGAIRQRKDDIVEQYGHKFAQQQFYNIMRCALCGDFLKYAAGMQCSDCKYTCHKKCYSKVVTKCISQSNAETDQDEAKLNHRIPHRFDAFANIGANWCCHCGYMLPIGKKNSRKCTECGLTCHQNCMHFVPDFCGMSMEVANQILGEIKNAKQRAPSQLSHASGMKKTLRPDRPMAPPERTSYSSAPGQDQGPQSPTRLSYNREGYDGQPRTQSYGGPASGTAADAARASYNQGQPPPQPPRPTSGQRTQSQSESAAIAAYGGKQPTSPQKPGQPGAPYGRQQPEYGSGRSSGGYGPGADQQGYGQTSPVNQQQPSNVQYNPAAYPPLSGSGYPAPAYGMPPQQQPQAPPKASYGQQQQPVPQPHPHEVPPQQEQAPPQQQMVSQRLPPGKSVPPANTAGTGRRIGLDHFNFLAVLGKGNFGKVMLAETKTTKQLYAIKVLKKEFIIENDEVESTRSEKRVFLIANKERHPFLLNLHACFQTETRVYFVMEYISGGDLMLHIQRGQFGTKRAQFYAAEVALALKYFHENGVIYRDLKLDNIMLTMDGHIKVADYGLCKEDMWYGSTTSTFCGTPEFMAPEILLDKKYGRAVDWWAFGVLIYQMLLQQSPFRGEDEDEIYEAILADEPLYPIHMPRDSVSILQKLLTREPEMRLGSGPTDAQEIMSHAFFRNINWDDVYHKRIPAPFLPSINSATDTSNFDQEFTSVTPVLTPVQSVLSQAMQEEFRGFSYCADFA